MYTSVKLKMEPNSEKAGASAGRPDVRPSQPAQEPADRTETGAKINLHVFQKFNNIFNYKLMNLCTYEAKDRVNAMK